MIPTFESETLGVLSFSAGGIVEYNPTTDIATLYFNEGPFSDNADVDAVHVTTLPEPAAVVLLGLGCLVLVGRKRT